VAELARGSVLDRPWGRTFATLALRGLTGQLTLVADGKHFLVAFEGGAVVAAMSPLASDAAVRVALTGHLVSSSQVPEISRRLADAPERDEVDVIAELARLGPDHALRLRRRVIAQRAARTFSINHGEFTVTDYIELPIIPGCELDVRAVVYMGARANLSEQRLSAELDQLGSWFQLKPDLDEDLPQFGFSDVEQPVIERLRDGGTIAELEEFASSFVDARTVRAVVYALASYNACEAAAPQLAAPQPPAPPAIPSTQPLHRLSQPPPGAAQPRAGTQPMPRTMTKPAAPDPSRAPRPTPEGSRPLRPTPIPGSGHLTPPPIPGSGHPTPPPISTAPLPVMPPMPARTTSPPGRLPTPPAPAASRAVTPPASPRAVTPAMPGDALDDGIDAPTQRDGVAAMPSQDPPPPAMRDRSSPGLVPPLDDRPLRDRSTPGLARPLDDGSRGELDATGRPLRDRSSAGLALPADDGPLRDRSTPGLRRPLEEAARVAEPAARGTRDRSTPGLRRPLEEAARMEPEAVPRATRDSRSSPVLRRSEDGPRSSSSPAIRIPSDDAGPDLVIRRVPASRPPPARQMARTDSPQSHDVKSLIAQRLKLLDQGADHFQLLGVSQDVPPDALRKAYFGLARQLHPDRLAALGISDDGKHAQRLFAQINTGFAILSSPARRSQYVDVLRRGGEAAVRAEQARAEDLARRILDAEEAFRRGELALRRDHPEGAVAEFELAVKLHPDEADYHALLAWAQFCAAPDKVAIAQRTRTSLDRVIQRSPRSVTPRFYLGRVERMLGCDKDALRHFRDVLAAAPGHAEAASEVRALEARLQAGDKPGGGLFGRTKR